jgi:hypothetical protein
VKGDEVEGPARQQSQDRATVKRLLQALEEESEALRMLRERPQRVQEDLGLDEREVTSLRRLLEAAEGSQALARLREHPEQLAEEIGLGEEELAALRSADLVTPERRRSAVRTDKDAADLHGLIQKIHKAIEGGHETLQHSSQPDRVSRREGLKRGVAVGGAIWAAPVIASIGPVFAQGTPPTTITFETGTTITGGSSTTITFETGTTITGHP